MPLVPLPLLLALPLPAAEDPPEAVELFEKAEAHVVKGRYERAVRTYMRLAEEFPGTEVGRMAERRARPSAFLGAVDLVRHGPSSNRVDVVLMGEGYELRHQDMFDDLAEGIPEAFERQRALGEYFSYFNFVRANLVSAESGVDGFGREYDTALDGRTLGTDAGHVGIDPGRVRVMLDELPEHDGQAIVFARLGVLGTGGGGIATIGGQSIRTVIHEFGHSFVGLGDEYDSRTHDRGAVRNAANVSNTDDPEQVPWRHWLEAKVKDVGIYEGAAGQVRGAWKPTPGGCVMDSGEFFCRPCREALVLRIYGLVDPIDACEPAAHERRSEESIELAADDELELTVTVLQPEDHDLEARWWVLPEAEAPQGPSSSPTRGGRYGRRATDRRGRGKLPALSPEPAHEDDDPDRHGVHAFELDAGDLEPGRYRVVCRVRDTTLVGRDRVPWVLRDEDGLLESERAWWVRVAEE